MSNSSTSIDRKQKLKLMPTDVKISIGVLATALLAAFVFQGIRTVVWHGAIYTVIFISTAVILDYFT